MKAFLNDEKIKEKYLKRVELHRKADELIKGTYWEKGKGCAVGCTIHSGNHASYETELGIPRILARLEDRIFEALPNDLAMSWPERFLESIRVGADLSKVWNKFAIWLLVDKEHGVIKYAKNSNTIKSIDDVANLYLRSLSEEIPAQAWIGAADAAAADATAAYAAAAYAAYADDAAYAAYAATAATAAGAVYADDAAGARQKAFIIQSEKLLELLREAK